MNYAETINRLEEQLQAIDEDPENPTYVFRELKGWTSPNFILRQNQAIIEKDQMLLE